MQLRSSDQASAAVAGATLDVPGAAVEHRPEDLIRDDLAPIVQLGRDDLEAIAGRPLLVATGGGHLSQLFRLRPRFTSMAADPVWITNRSPQARALLAGETVIWVPLVRPRDVPNVARCAWLARRMPRHEPSMVVSTGSGIALGFLPLLAAAGIPAHYVESATRVEGPSLTGRILGRLVPPVNVYTQHPRWSDHRWQYAGSVFEGFEAVPRRPQPDRIDKVVVTVGSLAYPFDRMIRRAKQIIPSHAEVLWQVGASDVDDLSIQARRSVPADELAEAIAEADVVLSHAGTGSALTAHEAGRCPVLLTREPAFGEHVDDHQVQTAGYLADLGLAVWAQVDELTPDDLWAAASRQVVPTRDPGPLVLA